MVKEVVKRYSKAFKLQVVREYEAGATLHQLRQKYGIGGGSTVQGWVAKYGRAGVRHQLLIIQSPVEQEQVKQLQQQVAQLEKALAQLTVEKLLLETTLAVAEEELGIRLKKKGVGKSLSGPASSGMSKGGASR